MLLVFVDAEQNLMRQKISGHKYQQDSYSTHSFWKNTSMQEGFTHAYRLSILNFLVIFLAILLMDLGKVAMSIATV